MIAGHTLTIWLVFAATIALLLTVDLGVTRHRVHAATLREAGGWSVAVVMVALLFGGLIWLREGRANAVQFAAGYVVELSLSVDNLLVFMLVLHYFAVPAALQPSVLKWGILGAMAMRGVMIAIGTVLLHELSWVIYLLGAVLVFTGAKLFARPDAGGIEPGNNPLLRAARRILPLTERFHDRALFVRVAGRNLATPLLLVVLVVEWTDLVFATDSIPAIFAITRDPFLVYTSNIFAVVGLRALFFLLAGILTRFVYLRSGVALVLMLVGVKMLASPWIRVPPEVTLAVVVGVLGLSVVASLRK
jgi:tellurite resistance protein TerC